MNKQQKYRYHLKRAGGESHIPLDCLTRDLNNRKKKILHLASRWREPQQYAGSEIGFLISTVKLLNSR